MILAWVVEGLALPPHPPSKLTQGEDWVDLKEALGVWHPDLTFRFVFNRVILLPS